MSEVKAPYPRKHNGLKTIAIAFQLLAMLTMIVGIAYLIGGIASASGTRLDTSFLIFFGAFLTGLVLACLGLAIEVFLNMAFDQQRQADAMERIANRRRDG